MKYLLRNDGDYYFGFELEDDAKTPEGEQYSVVGSLVGSAIASSVVVEIDDENNPVYWTPSIDDLAEIALDAIYADGMGQLLVSRKIHAKGVGYPTLAKAALAIFESKEYTDADTFYQDVLVDLGV